RDASSFVPWRHPENDNPDASATEMLRARSGPVNDERVGTAALALTSRRLAKHLEDQGIRRRADANLLCRSGHDVHTLIVAACVGWEQEEASAIRRVGQRIP